MAAEMNKNMRSAEGEEKEQQTGRAKKPPLGKLLYRLLILRGSRATDENLRALDKRIEQMKTKIREIEKSKVLEENTGQAIVTFNYEVNASACVADHVSDIEEWFVRKLRREPNAPKFRGKTAIRVERAPEPSDIVWRNMGFNTKGGGDNNSRNSLLRNRHVHAFFIMTGSLVAFCIAQWYAERWRTRIRLDILKKAALNGGEVSISDTDQNVLRVLKITSALTISLINVILTQIAKAVNSYERYKSHSIANTMLLGKLVLVHALNVCAIWSTSLIWRTSTRISSSFSGCLSFCAASRAMGSLTLLGRHWSMQPPKLKSTTKLVSLKYRLKNSLVTVACTRPACP